MSNGIIYYVFFFFLEFVRCKVASIYFMYALVFFSIQWLYFSSKTTFCGRKKSLKSFAESTPNHNIGYRENLRKTSNRLHFGLKFRHATRAARVYILLRRYVDSQNNVSIVFGRSRTLSSSACRRVSWARIRFSATATTTIYHFFRTTYVTR